MAAKNIFLIGLMGSGKSSVGKLLAARLGKDFHDSDDEVVKRTGVDIQTIFDIEGEDSFREREQKVIEDLTGLDNVVLATGGGAVLRQENRRNLKSRGFVIYLNAGAGQLYNRLRYDKTRPLLQTDNPKAKLKSLLTAREPLYLETADWIFNSGSMKSCKMAANRIIRHLESNANS